MIKKRKWTCPACGSKCLVTGKAQKIEHLEDDLSEAYDMDISAYELMRAVESALDKLK